jgi:hypothetical protein
VAAVVVPFLGHVGGEERTLGDFGVGGVSAPVAPDHVSAAYLGDSAQVSEAYLEDGEWDKGFFERKLSASAPSVAMPIGIITVLGAPMRLPSPQ